MSEDLNLNKQRFLCDIRRQKKKTQLTHQRDRLRQVLLDTQLQDITRKCTKGKLNVLAESLGDTPTRNLSLTDLQCSLLTDEVLDMQEPPYKFLNLLFSNLDFDSQQRLASAGMYSFVAPCEMPQQDISGYLKLASKIVRVYPKAKKYLFQKPIISCIFQKGHEGFLDEDLCQLFKRLVAEKINPTCCFYRSFVECLKHFVNLLSSVKEGLEDLCEALSSILHWGDTLIYRECVSNGILPKSFSRLSDGVQFLAVSRLNTLFSVIYNLYPNDQKLDQDELLSLSTFYEVLLKFQISGIQGRKLPPCTYRPIFFTLSNLVLNSLYNKYLLTKQLFMFLCESLENQQIYGEDRVLCEILNCVINLFDGVSVQALEDVVMQCGMVSRLVLLYDDPRWGECIRVFVMEILVQLAEASDKVAVALREGYRDSRINVGDEDQSGNLQRLKQRLQDASSGSG